MMSDLIDVKRELRLNMLVFAFIVCHHGPILGAKFWKLDGHRAICRQRMSERVANVVGKRANGESKFVRILRIAEKADDKIARAHVVSQVRKGCIAERVV